jgi:hypothetical protein
MNFMKRFFVFTVIAILLLKNGKACDICGCGVGGNYIGILPEFHKHIFGIRYRTNSMLTHLGVGGNTTYLTTKERYRTLELWGGWNIGKKFRAMATIPYNFNERVNQGTTASKHGIGDISVSGYYQLLNGRKTIHSTKLLVQSLWIGAGIKLPTGKYDPADKQNTSSNANLFQLGTGSLDYTLNGMYDVRIQDVGLNMAASYKVNTSNKYGYSYGNKFNISAQAYYKIRVLKTWLVAPNAGIVYETTKKDVDNKILVDISGGNLLQATLGMELSYNKMAIGGNWQTPLSQNLANGIVKANNRAMVHISFLF